MTNETDAPELDSFKDVDPYKVLGLDSKCSADEIKRAYRRKALVTHPDKARTEEDKTAFHSEFQRVAFAYSVLSDERRKARYDRTGSLEEVLIEDDEEDLGSLFAELCKGATVSKELIEEDKVQYRASGEEEQDILYFYTESKGDMDVIFESVPHTSVVEDEERIRTLISKAIKDGRVKSYTKFTKESDKNIKRRKKRALNEAKEAEELAAELGIGNKVASSTEHELALLIRNKSQKRFDSMIERLEEKYAPKKKASTSKSKVTKSTKRSQK